MNKDQQIATITLATAEKIAQAVEAKALEVGVPVVLPMMGHGRNMPLVQRIDDASVTSCDISLNRTYTACYPRQSTREITDVVQSGAPLCGLQLTNRQRTAIFSGGLLVILSDKLIGTIGVNGGTAEQDILLTETVLNCFSGL